MASSSAPSSAAASTPAGNGGASSVVHVALVESVEKRNAEISALRAELVKTRAERDEAVAARDALYMATFEALGAALRDGRPDVVFLAGGEGQLRGAAADALAPALRGALHMAECHNLYECAQALRNCGARDRARADPPRAPPPPGGPLLLSTPLPLSILRGRVAFTPALRARDAQSEAARRAVVHVVPSLVPLSLSLSPPLPLPLPLTRAAALAQAP